MVIQDLPGVFPVWYFWYTTLSSHVHRNHIHRFDEYMSVLSILEPAEAQQRTSLFPHSKKSVYKQEKIPFNIFSGPASFYFVLFHLLCISPLVFLGVIITAFWQGIGENIKNLRDVFSKTCHWPLHFTIQRLKIWFQVGWQ